SDLRLIILKPRLYLIGIKEPNVTVMTGNHYANNQKDPYMSTTYIPVELTLYGLARYNYPPFNEFVRKLKSRVRGARPNDVSSDSQQTRDKPIGPLRLDTRTT